MSFVQDVVDFMLEEIRRVAEKDVFIAVKAAHANEPFETSEDDGPPSIFLASQNLTADGRNRGE